MIYETVGAVRKSSSPDVLVVSRLSSARSAGEASVFAFNYWRQKKFTVLDVMTRKMDTFCRFPVSEIKKYPYIKDAATKGPDEILLLPLLNSITTPPSFSICGIKVK